MLSGTKTALVALVLGALGTRAVAQGPEIEEPCIAGVIYPADNKTAGYDVWLVRNSFGREVGFSVSGYRLQSPTPPGAVFSTIPSAPTTLQPGQVPYLDLFYVDTLWQWNPASVRADRCYRREFPNNLIKRYAEVVQPLGVASVKDVITRPYTPPPQDCGPSTTSIARGSHTASMTSSSIGRISLADSTTTTPQCGANTGTAGNGDPPRQDPGPHCVWARDFVLYYDLSWDWLSDWYRDCTGVGEMSMAPTGTATITAPTTNGACTTVLTSDDQYVAEVSPSGLVSTAGAGRTYLKSICPGKTRAAPFDVMAWYRLSPQPTPTCTTFYFYHKGDDGHWMDTGQKCLDSASTISPPQVMAADPATDAVQRAMPLGQAEYLPCASASNVCWIGFFNDDQYLRSGAYFDCPQLSHIGGDASAYPVTMTYRVNGQVVQTSTGVDAAHFPQPPTTCQAAAPPGGWTGGDIVAVSATLTDARGVTITAATWVGWPPDDGSASAPVPDASNGAKSRAKANSTLGPNQASDAARIMARQAELRALAGIQLQPWEIRQNWQHGQP